ncbi:unnamed protein product [Anisakis simplex]|uniref:DUF4440 domain-containing protein n=1 Tax=Anisakis simplex TaxID=6269 RepID=A0A0M3KE35_ANISI|nr:unnamed protein product [Anisakis simplex]
MHTSNVISVTLFVLLNLCNTAQADLQEEIEARNAELRNLYKAKNISAAIKFYHKNVTFMITGREPLKGRPAVKEYFSKDQGHGGTPVIQLNVHEINGDDKWAFERGSFDVTWADGKKKGNGMYLKVWKKNADNKWVIYADSTNYINLPQKSETK